MPEQADAHVPGDSWILDVRELAHQPGSSRAYSRQVPAPEGFGLDLISVPTGAAVRLDVLAESVVEGVLVSGTAAADLAGECARCLDPVAEEVEVEVRELFAYPDSATDASTEEDEVERIADDQIDLQSVVRDAMLPAMPSAPVCSPDCPGLCAGCGAKWVDLAADHTHETIDPRWAALRERFGGTEKES
ncbi:YceD family protein [Salinifilum aidingensis]